MAGRGGCRAGAPLGEKRDPRCGRQGEEQQEGPFERRSPAAHGWSGRERRSDRPVRLAGLTRRRQRPVGGVLSKPLRTRIALRCRFGRRAHDRSRGHVRVSRRRERGRRHEGDRHGSPARREPVVEGRRDDRGPDDSRDFERSGRRLPLARRARCRHEPGILDCEPRSRSLDGRNTQRRLRGRIGAVG